MNCYITNDEYCFIDAIWSKYTNSSKSMVLPKHENLMVLLTKNGQSTDVPIKQASGKLWRLLFKVLTLTISYHIGAGETMETSPSCDNMPWWRHHMETVCPYKWPFKKRIHQWPMGSSDKGPLIWIFDIFFVVSPNKPVWLVIMWRHRPC